MSDREVIAITGPVSREMLLRETLTRALTNGIPVTALVSIILLYSQPIPETTTLLASFDRPAPPPTRKSAGAIATSNSTATPPAVVEPPPINPLLTDESFRNPYCCAIWTDRSEPHNRYLLYTYRNNHSIQCIGLSPHQFRVFAGHATEQGETNGALKRARFRHLRAIAVNPFDNSILIAQSHSVRRIKDGAVSHLCGLSPKSDHASNAKYYRSPEPVRPKEPEPATDSNGLPRLRMGCHAKCNHCGVRKAMDDADGLPHLFDSLSHVAVSSSGEFAIASDYTAHTIYQIDCKSGEVTKLVGGHDRHIDGHFQNAAIRQPETICINPGTSIVPRADTVCYILCGDGVIRVLNLYLRVVTTLQPSNPADLQLNGMAFIPAENLLLLTAGDTQKSGVVSMDMSGHMELVAGASARAAIADAHNPEPPPSPPGAKPVIKPGRPHHQSVDGLNASTASFEFPRSIAVHPSPELDNGVAYVCDGAGYIRRVGLPPNWFL